MMQSLVKHAYLILLLPLITTCKTPPPPTVERVYLLGWEIDTFTETESCRALMRHLAVPRMAALLSSESTELVFRGGHLAEVYNISGTYRNPKPLTKKEQRFKYFELKANDLYRPVSGGDSHIGGEAPPGFVVPSFEFVAPFQYVGKYSKSDPVFAWLPFDLHLVTPICFTTDKVFIDYSNPMKPMVLQSELLKIDRLPCRNLKADSEITYEKIPFKMQKMVVPTYDGMVVAGVPSWIQHPEIPVCPKTKRPMRFLCQLRELGKTKVARTNIEATSPADLNYWDGGELYIFFEPESKIACILYQNT